MRHNLNRGYSKIYNSSDQFSLLEDSTFVFGYSVELRSHWIEEKMDLKLDSIRFVKIEESGKDCIRNIEANQEYSLKSSMQLIDFFKLNSAKHLYIDVTGLDNRICAPLVKIALECVGLKYFSTLIILYAEPKHYNIQKFKDQGMFHDLSEKIEGIEPLPGFATIFPEGDNVHFVPLLGFEGGRFTHIWENIQQPQQTTPIIGVPGFRIEYPFVAYWGNRRPLKNTGSWRSVQYAAANSIVDAYLLLSEILRRDPRSKFTLAPIGTKPHAIASFLLAIKYPSRVEIIYDNPKKRKVRTDGVGKIIESYVWQLLQEN